MKRLYAYCLCGGGGADLPDLGGACGVGGAPPRVLGVGGFAAVVGDFDRGHVAVNREDLLAHNRVNGLVLALTTPLPFRFGTLVTPEQLADYALRNEAALRAALARVRGSVEMSVKLIRRTDAGQPPPGAEAGEAPAPGDASRPAREAAAVDESTAAAVDDSPVAVGLGPSAGGRGTAYLAARRQAILGDERLRAGAEEMAAGLARGVSGFVRESSVRLSPAEALAVRASHLVERERVADYRARLREFGASRPDLRLLASGPWPPYSFAA